MIKAPERESVQAAVTRLFPEREQAEVLAILERYGTEDYEREIWRVRLYILKLSEGNKNKLPSLIKRAKRDYRDIIAWAEQSHRNLPTDRGLPPDISDHR